MLLEVRNLEVFYGRIQAIKGISFTVDAGEVVTPATPHECVENARAHHQVALAELPPSAFPLSAGEPAIPTRVL